MKKILVVKTISTPVIRRRTLDSFMLELAATSRLIDEISEYFGIDEEIMEEVRREECEKRAEYVRSHYNFLRQLNSRFVSVDYMSYGQREFALMIFETQMRHVEITDMPNRQISERLVEVCVTTA